MATIGDELTLKPELRGAFNASHSLFQSKCLGLQRDCEEVRALDEKLLRIMQPLQGGKVPKAIGKERRTQCLTGVEREVRQVEQSRKSAFALAAKLRFGIREFQDAISCMDPVEKKDHQTALERLRACQDQTNRLYGGLSGASMKAQTRRQQILSAAKVFFIP